MENIFIPLLLIVDLDQKSGKVLRCVYWSLLRKTVGLKVLLIWKVFQYLLKDFCLALLVETCLTPSSDPVSNPTDWDYPKCTQNATVHTWKLEFLDSDQALLFCIVGLCEIILGKHFLTYLLSPDSHSSKKCTWMDFSLIQKFVWTFP